MKNKAWMGIVLLAFVTAGAVFAQSPTLDKLTLTSKRSGGQNYYEVKATNRNINGAIVIPDFQNNVPVTTIPNDAFLSCNNITSVTILGSVTTIGMSAFRLCSSLASVTIPASVTSINTRAFNNCPLTSVTFGGSNTSVIATGSSASFPGDLGVVYQAGGAGTYTRPANSSNWTKQVVAAPSLDGNWRVQPDGDKFISISGNTAVFSDFARNLSIPWWQSAKDKGLVKVGDTYLRNLRSTGNSTWTGQQMGIRYNTRTNEADSIIWRDCTITFNGVTFTVDNGDEWIRAGVQ
jgi:hypothetical protein